MPGAIENIWASPALAALASASVVSALVEHARDLGERLAGRGVRAERPGELVARRAPAAGPRR